jgi:hypothetical protein
MGIDLGMFYKRRDYSVIINGKNPIVAHEYLGRDVKDKDVIIIDDMISSGDSVIDVAQQLKSKGAKRIFIFSTFGLFCNGLENMDKAYNEGIFTKIFTTNLVYRMPELLKREWEHDDIRHNYLLELEACEHKHAVEKKETDHKILINKLEAEARWWEQVGDAETAAKVREIASRQQIKEETDWLEVKRLKQDLEIQRKAKSVELLKSMTFEQLLAFEDDPEKRADLIKLHHMQLQSKMSAQQILATLGKSDHNDEYVAKMAELHRETADRADKNFSRIVDPLRVGVGGNIFRDDHNTAYENKNQPNFRP